MYLPIAQICGEWIKGLTGDNNKRKQIGQGVIQEEHDMCHFFVW